MLYCVGRLLSIAGLLPGLEKTTERQSICAKFGSNPPRHLRNYFNFKRQVFDSMEAGFSCNSDSPEIVDIFAGRHTFDVEVKASRANKLAC